MSDNEITINTLQELQNKYEKLYWSTKTETLKDRYYRAILAIDDIIEDIKEEE